MYICMYRMLLRLKYISLFVEACGTCSRWCIFLTISKLYYKYSTRVYTRTESHKVTVGNRIWLEHDIYMYNYKETIYLSYLAVRIRHNIT